MPEGAELAGLRDRIAASRAMACGMVHESVPRDRDGQPVAHAVEPDTYARPALCPAGRRDTQLACSHSTARLPLRRAIEALQARDGADAAALESLLAEWMRLDAALGTLDHRRYAAETRLADAVRASPGTATQEERSIAALVREHRDLALGLDALRDRILAAIDRALVS
ncbi:hypothetical protein BWR60_17285 [Inquilinus limosus]|uniref:Uncharacterized protein n=2 Tax=Inquilinus limosus TaxID=171674 RepID=A0A211ZL21_9PROT|nr:hypothetical protein BWR60_17285 [Inquilinus limosus]